MLILMIFYFLLMLYVAVRMTLATVRAWRPGGNRQERIFFPLMAAYFWYRSYMLGSMLWDVIGGVLVLLFIISRRTSR